MFIPSLYPITLSHQFFLIENYIARSFSKVTVKLTLLFSWISVGFQVNYPLQLSLIKCAFVSVNFWRTLSSQVSSLKNKISATSQNIIESLLKLQRNCGHGFDIELSFFFFFFAYKRQILDRKVKRNVFVFFSLPLLIHQSCVKPSPTEFRNYLNFTIHWCL